MVNILRFMVLFGVLISSASASVGFKEINLTTQTQHPLNIAVWYPAKEQKKTTTIATNKLFIGSQVSLNAEPISSGQHTHPLVVLSHGYSGSWRNLSWLAYELSSLGYIVAAPTHHDPLSSTQRNNQPAQLWLRPQELSMTIDAVLADRSFSKLIDQDKIAAIGHSLGGWTVLSLAGAQFDTRQFQQDCRTHSYLKACQLMNQLGLDQPEFIQPTRDERVKAVVTLDAGLTRGMTTESLQQFQLPILVIGAGNVASNREVKLESGHMQPFLPKQTSTFVFIFDATHFSFIQTCKPLTKGLWCQNGYQRDREEIHREVTYLILGFLTKLWSNNQLQPQDKF